MSDLLTDWSAASDGRSHPPEQPSAFAVASLVLSILWLGGLGSLVAVVLGIAALWPIRKAKSPKRGTGLAKAGIVIGAIGTVGTLLVVGLFVAIGRIDIKITLPPPSTYGLNIALSPDGTIGYVTEPASKRLLVLDTRTGAVTASIGVGDTPSGLAVSPDGKQVWVVNTGPFQKPGSVSAVSTYTHSVLGTIPVGPGPIDVAFSPDGRKAYVTNSGLPLPGGSVNVIDTSTLSVVHVLNPTVPPLPNSPGWNPTSVAVSPDGRQVWVSEVNLPGGNQQDFVYVFDAATDAQVARIGVGAGPFFMTLSRDGRDAYVADKTTCDAREIDTATYQVVGTVGWPSSHGCPFGLAASLDDSVVYTVTGNDHTIISEGAAGNSFGLVDFSTSTVVVHDGIGTDPVTLTLSPDGTKVFVVDAARPTVNVVNPATGLVTSAFTLPTASSISLGIPAMTVVSRRVLPRRDPPRVNKRPGHPDLAGS
jgi:YVTN family beta-propeller protein